MIDKKKNPAKQPPPKKTAKIKTKQNKKKQPIVNLAVPPDHRVNLKESEKGDKFLEFAWELKKTIEDESDSDTNCNWSA